MIRKFLQSASIYFIANALSKIMNFLFFAYLVRLLTVQQMGEFALLNVLLTILTLFMSFAIESGFSRYFLEITENEQRIFEFSSINLLLIFNIFFGSVVICFKMAIYKFFLPINDWLLYVMLIIPFISSVANIFLTKLRLQNYAKQVAYIMIIQSTFYVLSSFAFLITFTDKLMALFLGILAQHVLVCILYFFNLRKWVSSFNLDIVKKSLWFSFCLVPSNLGAYTSLFTGKYILGKFLDLISVGIFEASNKVAAIIGMIMEPLYLATIPIIYKNYKSPEFKEKYYKILEVNFIILFLLVLFFSLFNNEIVFIILGKQYVSYANLVYLFIITAFFMFIAKVIAVNIHLAQKSQYDTLVEILSGLINIILTIIFIKYYKLTGVIVAGIITYFIRMLLYMIFANKLFKEFYINPYYMFYYVLSTVSIIYIHYLINDLNIIHRIILIMIELGVFLNIIAKRNNIKLKELVKTLINMK
jgi:O-antigen/teichoic acid export membrane protein